MATAAGGGLVAGFSGVPSPTRASLVKLDASGAPQWQKFVGTASPTVSFSFDSVWAATDGGYVATGTQPSSGRNHGWVVKLDANGVVQWQQLFGTVYSDRCRAVCQSKDGAIIVAGLTQLNGSTSPDLWVAKLDLSSGALLWQRAFDGGAKVGEWEEAEAVCATSDGGIAVAGWATTGSLATDRGWIIKLASDGSVVWQKTYAHSKKLELFSIPQLRT